MDYLAVSNKKLKIKSQLKEATENDNELYVLKEIINSGWPEKKEDVPKSVRTYHTFRAELTTQNCIVFKGERIVNLQSTHNDMLSEYTMDMLVFKAVCRNERNFVWPTMSYDMENYVRMSNRKNRFCRTTREIVTVDRYSN